MEVLRRIIHESNIFFYFFFWNEPAGPMTRIEVIIGNLSLYLSLCVSFCEKKSDSKIS
jgi:hypothetical protein